MKTVLTLALLAVLAPASATATKAEIDAGQSIEIQYDDAFDHSTTIVNRSGAEIEIAVFDLTSGAQIRGFGLNARAKATVTVEQTAKLVITNPSDKKAKLDLDTYMLTPKVEATSSEENHESDETRYISFTLRNSSAKSIPLQIPGVMNPNLSPFSNSGVSLEIGQEVIYKTKGRKWTILKVSDAIKDGDVIDVAKLIKE